MTFTGSEKRHYVLVDIENAACTASPQADWVTCIQRTLEELLGLTGEELVAIGCSHHAAATVAFGWVGGRRLWRSGADGADLALLDVIEHEPVIRSCDRVTIVSGDGIFADALAGLGELGVETTVVAVRGHLATRSRLAAHNVVELEPWPWATSATGVA
jgi:hypothetical protein